MSTAPGRSSASRVAHFIFGTLALVGLSTASAEPRALLIGVGEYPNLARGAKLNPNLPGIDLDIANMQQVLTIMGFRPPQVRILFNDDATLDRVVHELNTWVRDGVEPGDPVVIYFSGHGTTIVDRNGDEPDGRDEVLVMSDTDRVRTANSVTLDKVLVDDTFGELLAKIPSHQVLVLVDACQSGTATRGFEIRDRRLGVAEGMPKFYYYEGMPLGGGVFAKGEQTGSANYVALSAATDTQSAVATYQGGLFTLGLRDAIARAAAEKRTPSLEQVRDEVDQFIARSIEPERRHDPVITGDTRLAEGGIVLVPSENGGGPLWAEVAELASKGNSLVVSTSRPAYQFGEEVEIRVDVPSEGFLNIITVDSQDRATVLFPNQYASSNAVRKGPLRIPSPEMKFILPAQAPAGPTLVAAFLSQQPVNARELGLEGRDASGRLTQTFTDLSAAATRAIGVAARKERFRAGKITVNVTPSESPK